MAKQTEEKDAPAINSTKFLRVMVIVFVLIVYFFLVLKTLLL